MSDSSIIDLIKNGGQPALGKIYATYRSEFISWMTRGYPISEVTAKTSIRLQSFGYTYQASSHFTG